MVVGPDMCGKTQIAKQLSLLTGVPYFKATNEHKMFLKDQQAFLHGLQHADPRVADLLAQTKASVIFDRSYPCEYVYSRYFGRETDLQLLRFVDKAYAQIGTKVAVCTRRSFAGIVDDLNPQLDGKALQEISQLYQEFVEWTHCSTYTLHVDDEDLFRESDELLEFMGYSHADRLTMLSQLVGLYD